MNNNKKLNKRCLKLGVTRNLIKTTTPQQMTIRRLNTEQEANQRALLAIRFLRRNYQPLHKTLMLAQNLINLNLIDDSLRMTLGFGMRVVITTLLVADCKKLLFLIRVKTFQII